MVSGTFVLTDSIDKAFDSIFSQTSTGAPTPRSRQVGVRPRRQRGDGAAVRRVAARRRCEALPDVAATRSAASPSDAQLIGKDGKAIVFGGAPNLGFSVDPTSPHVQHPDARTTGSGPAPDEVVVDQSTATKKDLAGRPDDRRRRPRGRSSSSGSPASSSSARSPRSAARRSRASTCRRRRSCSPRRASSTRSASRRSRASRPRSSWPRSSEILPPDTRCAPATDQAQEDAKDTDEFISFLRYFLLAFGGIALFVGAFVIVNSLSITIAQRTREFATLRTLGASRRQVLLSVMLEALVIGILASIVGLFLGLGLAKGLFKLFDAVGFTLPNSGLLFGDPTIIFSLLLGIIVTLIASLCPALRATRVPPIAAVREGADAAAGPVRALPDAGRGAHRPRSASPLLVLRALRARISARRRSCSACVGTLLSSSASRCSRAPFIRPLAGDPRLAGDAGSAAPPATLARDNARRNPQRTASTAAALMIGLALVTLVATLAAGIAQTFPGAVNEIFVGDYAITAQNNFSPIPIDAAEAAAKAPGVMAVGERPHRRDARVQRAPSSRPRSTPGAPR